MAGHGSTSYLVGVQLELHHQQTPLPLLQLSDTHYSARLRYNKLAPPLHITNRVLLPLEEPY